MPAHLRLPRLSRLLALLVVLALPHHVESAEWDVTLSLGDVITTNCDVTWQAPDTTLLYPDLSWTSDPWGGAPYYGVRAGFWPNDSSAWGVSLEMNHFKIVSRREREVHQSGQAGGVSVDSTAPLGEYFEALDFSNGNNLIVASLLWRHPLGVRGSGALRDRLQWLVGAGAGVSMPFSNVAHGAHVVREYQLAGPAWQVLAGGSVAVTHRCAVVVQYKLSHSRLSIDVNGATLSTHPWSHHLALGLRFST